LPKSMVCMCETAPSHSVNTVVSPFAQILVLLLMFCCCDPVKKADVSSADMKINGMPEGAPQMEFPAASARFEESNQSGRVLSAVRRLRNERDSLASELEEFFARHPGYHGHSVSNANPETPAGAVKHVSKETMASLRGLYNITLLEGVTVTEGVALDSQFVASLPEHASVILVEAAEELQHGQVRARIFDPDGYISVWREETWFIKKDNRLRDLLEASGVDYDSLSPRTLRAKDKQRAGMNRLKACEFSPLLYQLETILLSAGL